LFPNWPQDVDASYRTLRAAGAFLVSARLYDGVVAEVGLTARSGGGELRIELPWSSGAQLLSDGTTQRLESGIARLTTHPARSSGCARRQPEADRSAIKCVARSAGTGHADSA
jgi:alpha-L-fucosidase 2